MELLGTLVDDRIIISPSFIPLFFLFFRVNMPAISLYALCRSLSVRFTIRTIAEFSLSLSLFLSFFFPLRVELEVWYWTRMRYAANRGVEDLWDCGTRGIYVGIFNVFANMNIFWKFDNNRSSKNERSKI